MNKQVKICPCCMEEHAIKTITITEITDFKGVSVQYEAQYTYCEISDETYEDEQQLTLNDISMKNAYREKMGLLKSNQIADIRSKYEISQADLCTILGWGQKTITRYESHQVQDAAHDTILRKLDSDPEWFLELLEASKDSISSSAYSKYVNAGTVLFENYHDNYLKTAILSRYARFAHNSEANGNRDLSLDVVVDMIHYYANSNKVTGLYLIKLLKMLWYADTLSYKRYGHSISGLVYKSLNMGAAPVAYETIIDLSTINTEIIEFDNGCGQKILKSNNNEYKHLTPNDIEVLDVVSNRFGKATTNEIVESMHNEPSFKKTANKEIILYKYANSLSID